MATVNSSLAPAKPAKEASLFFFITKMAGRAAASASPNR